MVSAHSAFYQFFSFEPFLANMTFRMFFAYVFIFKWIIAVSRGTAHITLKEVFRESAARAGLSYETKKAPNIDRIPALLTTYRAV
jgi:hypothetical protein